MTWSGRRALAGMVLCAALGVASPAAASGGGGTPLPKVTGPLAVTPTSYPFGAADHTLVPRSANTMWPGTPVPNDRDAPAANDG